MKIDFHAHAFPEAFFLKLQEYYPDEVVLRHDAQGHLIGFWVGTPLPAWDHGQRIDDMNAGGVRIGSLKGIFPRRGHRPPPPAATARS